MKRIVFLLLILCSLTAFSQEKSHNMGSIVGADSTYFWKPFRTNGPVYACFDFTGFSTDSVEIDVFYVFKNDDDELKPIGVELGLGTEFPVTLVKATYQTIVNGDTTNMVCVKIPDNFLGDQFAYKATPHNALITDILKVYIRK